jgi:hypothetical protein
VAANKRLIVPLWAQRIQVERQDGALLVHGWGHFPHYLDDEQSETGSDLLQLLGRYAHRKLDDERQEVQSAYVFADAATDAKLEKFCGDYGPTWGEVKSFSNEGATGGRTVTVEQSLARLRRQQQIFRAAVEVLGELNGHADPRRLANSVGKIGYVVPADASKCPGPKPGKLLDFGGKAPAQAPWPLSQITEFRLGWYAVNAEQAAVAQNKQKVIDCAHGALCELLNDYAPILVPTSGQPVEMPRVSAQGILPALYYQLRQDYLAKRSIGTCLACGGHFPVERRGQKGCSEKCRRKLRNLRFRSQKPGRGRRAKSRPNK